MSNQRPKFSLLQCTILPYSASTAALSEFIDIIHEGREGVKWELGFALF